MREETGSITQARMTQKDLTREQQGRNMAYVYGNTKALYNVLLDRNVSHTGLQEGVLIVHVDASA